MYKYVISTTEKTHPFEKKKRSGHGGTRGTASALLIATDHHNFCSLSIALLYSVVITAKRYFISEFTAAIDQIESATFIIMELKVASSSVFCHMHKFGIGSSLFGI